MNDAADAPAPAARPTGLGTCLVVGAVLGLAFVVLPRVLLAPSIDREAPRLLALAVFGALTAAGAALTPRRALGLPRAALLVGVIAAAGGFAIALAAADVNPTLTRVLRAETVGALFYPLLAVGAALVAAPLLVPLGALVAIVVGSEGRRELPGVLIGLAAGLLAGPLLADLLLGARSSLEVCAVLALAAAVQVATYGPRTVEARRLPVGALPRLLAGGCAGVLAARVLVLHSDWGVLAGPWLAGLTSLAAAVGVVAGRGRLGHLAPLVLVGAILMLAARFPHRVPVRGLSARDVPGDLAVLLATALPLGLGLGLTIARPGRGARLGVAALALLLTGPLVPLLLLPRVGPEITACALALLVALAFRGVPRPIAAFALLGAVAAGVTVDTWRAEPPDTHGFLGAPVTDTPVERYTQDGYMTQIDNWWDEDLGRWVAIDGHAPLGRSLLHEQRLVHVPAMLVPPFERMLLVSTDGGEFIRAAVAHDPERVDWLCPFPPNLANEEESLDFWFTQEIVLRHAGNERMFLAGTDERYDVILMTPDPRAPTRGQLVATQEFYAEVRERLEPDGIFCQWWDPGAFDVSDLKRVIASLHQTFEHAYLLLDHPRERHPYIGFIGRREPLSVSPSRINRRLEDAPEVAAPLRQVGLHGLLIACLVSADRGMLEILAPREDALVDDRPELSVRTALWPRPQPQSLLVGMQTFNNRRRHPTPWLDTSREVEEMIARLPLTLRNINRGWQHLMGGAQQVALDAGPSGAPAFEMELGVDIPEAEAEALIQALVSRPLVQYLAPLVIGYARRLEAEQGIEVAETYLRRAVATAEWSGELFLGLAELIERKGDADDALSLYATAVLFDPSLDEARGAIARLAPRPDDD